MVVRIHIWARNLPRAPARRAESRLHLQRHAHIDQRRQYRTGERECAARMPLGWPARDFGGQIHVQSPAQGSGAGSTYVVIEPNTGVLTLADQLTIANSVVSVTQSPVTIATASSNASSSPVTLTVPGEAVINTQRLSATSNGPAQSCGGTAGFKTAWWRVTAPSSGYLQARAYATRTDVSVGNSGIVMTAYPQGSLNMELACGNGPRDTNPQIDTTIQFPVTAGAQYLIDISATGATPNDGGTTVLAVTMGGAPTIVSVTPATVFIVPGSGRTQQFSGASIDSYPIRRTLVDRAGDRPHFDLGRLYPAECGRIRRHRDRNRDLLRGPHQAGVGHREPPAATERGARRDPGGNGRGAEPDHRAQYLDRDQGHQFSARHPDLAGTDFVNNQLPTRTRRRSA